MTLSPIADGFGTPNSNPRTPPASNKHSSSILQYDTSEDDNLIGPENPSPSKKLFQRKFSRVDNEASPSSAVDLPESPRKGSKSPDSTRCSVTLDRSPSPNNNLSRCIKISLIPILFFSVIALYYYCYFPINSAPLKVGHPRKVDIEEKLVGELLKIQGQFPAQATDVWRVSMGAIGSILREDPEQPAVLLLIGSNTPESDKTINCLARKLANTLNKLYNKSVDVVVNVRDVKRQGQSPEEVKEAVDLRMRTILEKSRALVVSNIQELPASSALLLHGYCDNFMAPFKDRAIILTVLFDPVYLQEKGKRKLRLQDQTDRLLRRLWDEELGADKSASLVSRVANYPIMVVPEPELASCF